MKLRRRDFLRVAAGGVAAFIGACTSRTIPAAWRQVFSSSFSSGGGSWGERWINVRWAGALAQQGDRGTIEVSRGHPAVTHLKDGFFSQMARPVVVRDVVASDCKAAARFELEGAAAAGLLARWRYDEAYALWVGGDRVALYRYATTDHALLDSARIAAKGGPINAELVTEAGHVRGRVHQGDRSVTVASVDPDPLPPGRPGVVAGPTATRRAGRAVFDSFRVEARDGAGARPELAYRFAGAIVPTRGSSPTYKARVTARSIAAEPIFFELATDERFTDAQKTPVLQPEGHLGAVHAWLGDLRGGTRYHWRPVMEGAGARVAGEAASFSTPPDPGGAVRFGFGSCSAGRSTSYPSFEVAASFEPDFYLHAGDFGYPDKISPLLGPDQFQGRWTRLVRSAGVRSLTAIAPLLVTQDDHDYQANNGWAATIAPYTVWSFDEFHANPGPRYFDIRWGDVHVWSVDCRLEASDPAAPDGPRKTRIGLDQRAWLMRSMTASDAPVKIVAAGMPFRNKRIRDPSWAYAYAWERDHLLGFFAGLDATVFILSGDAHGQRLIHHFEFGDLYEVTSSGTDFPPGMSFTQGNHDPRHTLVDIEQTPGFAIAELGEAGPDRTLTVRVIGSADGKELFSKKVPVAS